MYTLGAAMKTVNLTKFREHLGEIVNRVKVSGEPVELTIHGKGQVLLYPHISEAEEDAMLGIMAAEGDKEGGRWLSHEDVGKTIKRKKR
jgi:prevent-host-death family protein